MTLIWIQARQILPRWTYLSHHTPDIQNEGDIRKRNVGVKIDSMTPSRIAQSL